MVVAPKSLMASLDLKHLLGRAICENDYETCGVLWGKVLAVQAKKKPQKKSSARVHATGKRSSKRVLMKRRARLQGCRRRSFGGMERRVRTLKRLIPKSESVGLEGLFRKTADYILSLEMRVRVMQILVDVLTVKRY